MRTLENRLFPGSAVSSVPPRIRPLEPLEPRLMLSSYTLQNIAYFNGINGALPEAGLIMDDLGNLYGTTSTGGNTGANAGAVFEVVKGSGAIMVLASFDDPIGGQQPLGRLVMDGSGNLYGTTSLGGIFLGDNGTVFEVVKDSGVITTLASFDGDKGSDPKSGLVIDDSGNLYGTAYSGGANGDGAVFEVVKGSGVVTLLASFDRDNGQGPYAGLVMDDQGNLYGTTVTGGAHGDGTVFEVVKGSGTITDLAVFDGTNGAQPYGGLIMDDSGNLYGTTSGGSSNVFEVVKGSGTITPRASFGGRLGSQPMADLIKDSSGNLFGTTLGGGDDGIGTVFEVVKGSGTITRLVSFNGTNGWDPYGSLIMDDSGNLFGTTYFGSQNNSPGNGNIFELSPGAGSPPTVTTSSGVLSYTTGAGAVPVDPGIGISGMGSSTLAGAVVTVSANYAGDQDVLGFASQNGITGSWDAAKGILTLSGSASVANYQAALRSVTYNNTSASPSTLARTVSFVANNGTTSSTPAARTIDVAGESFVDLTGVFRTAWTLPSAVVATLPLKGTASVVVKNIGNVKLPTGQQVNIQLIAHDTTNTANPDITLATLSNQSVSALAAGGSKQFTATVNLASGLPADGYQLLANITPVQDLTESDTTNNQVSQTAAGATQTIRSAAPFVDLTAQFGPTMIPPANLKSGDGTLVHVPVVVKNQGNVPLLPGQKIDIEIDAFDGTTTTPIKLLTGQTVSSLKPSASKTFTAAVTLPPGLQTGTYNLKATVDSSNLVTESDETNNTVTSSSTIAVTYGFVDLAGVFGTAWTLPSAVVAGLPLKGTASVVVKNLGDVALPMGQKVNITLVAHDTTNVANADTTLATLSNQMVSGLAAGGTKQFTAPVNLAAGLSSDDYQILANITPVQALTESDTTNNQAFETAAGATRTITSAPPFVDLAAQFGPAMKLPDSLTSGGGKPVTVPVVVKNLGNVSLLPGQKINVEIDAFDGVTTTLLKPLTALSVSSLKPGASATFTGIVTFPISLTTGTYNVLATADSSNLVTESDETNNTATSPGTIAVTQGFLDLSGSRFGTSTLHSSISANTPLKGIISVTMMNVGTVAIPASQQGTIQLVAHNTATNADIPLATIDGTLTAALAVGAAKQLSDDVDLPGGLPSGSYQIEATITPVNNQAFFNAAFYTVLTNALGNTLNFTVI